MLDGGLKIGTDGVVTAATFEIGRSMGGDSTARGLVTGAVGGSGIGGKGNGT